MLDRGGKQQKMLQISAQTLDKLINHSYRVSLRLGRLSYGLTDFRYHNKMDRLYIMDSACQRLI